jgi:LPXTG-motif cell wall-anchored protein
LTLRRTRTLASGCSLVGVAALAAVLTAPPAVAEKGPTGSAYALSAATTLLDQPLVTIDPRPTAVYPRGGSDSLVRVGPDVAGLVTANALTASSTLRGRAVVSEASIADVTVKDVLRAEVIRADCTAGPGGISGTSSIADLTVLGQRIDVSVAGEIDVLGVAKVRVNEQVRTGDTLTVNAVRVIVGGPVGTVASADIVLSQAKCAWQGGTGHPSDPPPTTTTTTTTTTVPTTPPAGEPPTSSSTTEPRPTTSTTPARGFRKTADDEDLADTGASGILPISLAGLVLLAGGGSALFVARRKRATTNDASDR